MFSYFLSWKDILYWTDTNTEWQRCDSELKANSSRVDQERQLLSKLKPNSTGSVTLTKVPWWIYHECILLAVTLHRWGSDHRQRRPFEGFLACLTDNVSFVSFKQKCCCYRGCVSIAWRRTHIVFRSVDDPGGPGVCELIRASLMYSRNQ